MVDSLGFLFASAVGGKQTVGHSLLVSVSTAMQRIMSRRHIAFVVTNHTYHPPRDQLSFSCFWS